MFSDPANRCVRSLGNQARPCDSGPKAARTEARTSARKREVRAAREAPAHLSGRPLCRRWRAHRSVSCDKESDTSWVAPFHMGSGSQLFRRPGLVRRADVRKHAEQILVRSYLILRHFSIGKERKEEIYDIVGECP